MKLFKIKFKVGKFEKEALKGGASVEDAFGKVTRDYRKAAKPPVLISHELIKDYGQHVALFTIDAEKECDELRKQILEGE
jgi:hypothetical protein